MRIISILLGLLCIVLGGQVSSHGPSDIQIGIGTTGIMGGIILIFVGVLIAGQEKNRRMLAKLLSVQERLKPAEAAPMTEEDRTAYDTRVAKVRPGRFSD